MKALFVFILVITAGLSAQETATKVVNATSSGSGGAVSDTVRPSIAGSGTANYVPLWTDSSGDLGNSVIYQSGSKVGINTTTPTGTLSVNGSVSATSFNIGAHPFAVGSYATWNVMLGFSGNFNMTGIGNTASGYKALFSNTTGQVNTATGTEALYYNTTGFSNTATGWEALAANTTGDWNTASGHAVLNSNTTGSGNTASGEEALLRSSTGSYNTASGLLALEYNTTGSYNTALGYNAGPDSWSTNLTNATAIGANAVVSQSNALVLGGTTGNGYAVNVGIGTATPAYRLTLFQGGGAAMADAWSTWSSRRWKTNIQPLQGALAKVEQLRGVSYDLKVNGKHEIGVIAEEVGTVVPEVVTWDKNSKDAQGVDYGRLTALLIEATKEQQTLIHQQQEQITAQQAQIARLSSQVKAIQASLSMQGRTGSEVRTVKVQVPVVQQ
jgi:hypothetical protein